MKWNGEESWERTMEESKSKAVLFSPVARKKEGKGEGRVPQERKAERKADGSGSVCFHDVCF